jgi:hemerythrin
MPIMCWNESLDVGVPAMNAEHQDILNAMNAIYDAHKAGESGGAINAQVARLGEICVRHFADEEHFMTAIGFPDLAIHRVMHAKLLEEFRDHAADIEKAGGRANDAFFQFLKYWLSAHIRGVDVKYGRYANSTAAKRP